MESPFHRALPILEKIEEAGFEAYFVGGSVRDFLLGRKIADVDIATSATPDEIKKIFPKTIDTGLKHGTVTVLFQGDSYEVTTFRAESEYVDFRRPKEVQFIRSLKEDLQRRDFTINGIAMDKKGNIIDPFGGQMDLKNQLIRTVGQAEERFHEDALRMMRALRFMSQLSFTIHPETLQALKENGYLLKHIAMERIVVEFEKLLMGNNYQEAIKMLIQTNIYQYLPHLTKEGLETYLRLMIPSHLTILERWVLLAFSLRMNSNHINHWLRKWKLATAQIKSIQSLLRWLEFRMNGEWTLEQLYSAYEYATNTEILLNLIHDRNWDEGIEHLQVQLAFLPIKSRKELDVNGHDVMGWFDRRGGPWIEEIFKEIERAIIYRQVKNDKEAIKEWLFKWNQK